MIFNQANAQFVTNDASNLKVFKLFRFLRREVRSTHRQMGSVTTWLACSLSLHRLKKPC